MHVVGAGGISRLAAFAPARAETNKRPNVCFVQTSLCKYEVKCIWIMRNVTGTGLLDAWSRGTGCSNMREPEPDRPNGHYSHDRVNPKNVIANVGNLPFILVIAVRKSHH